MTGNADNTPPAGERHGAGTYQMLWDCKFCGTEKLLGLTHRHCPNCGAAQDPERRYLPAEEDMVAVADHRFVGADKLCPACAQPNSAASAYCSECGADLGGADAVTTQAGRDLGEGRAESATKRDVVKDRFEAEMARVEDETPEPRFLGIKRGYWFAMVGIALAVAIIGGIIYAFTYREETRAEVVDMSWERTIEIESFEARSGQGWDEQVPGDAYNRTCDRRQRGTEKVQVGSREECSDVPQGDGTFRRDCREVPVYEDRPVYDQWCTYTVDRWDFERRVQSDGHWLDPAPYWPDYTLASGVGRFGEERVGSQHETYTVVVQEAGGKRFTCEVGSYEEWQRYDAGTPVTLDLRITGGADCGSLKIAN